MNVFRCMWQKATNHRSVKAFNQIFGKNSSGIFALGMKEFASRREIEARGQASKPFFSPQYRASPLLQIKQSYYLLQYQESEKASLKYLLATADRFKHEIKKYESQGGGGDSNPILSAPDTQRPDRRNYPN